MECADRDDDLETATAACDELKNELEKVITFLSRPDWIELAKKEKVIMDEKLNASITC